jgi:hypothetical protein
MKTYRVSWHIDVEANNPLEAATAARAAQHPATHALVFNVVDEVGCMTQVDLLDSSMKQMPNVHRRLETLVRHHLEQVKTFNLKCRKNEHTDTGEVWELLNAFKDKAHRVLRHIANP